MALIEAEPVTTVTEPKPSATALRARRYRQRRANGVLAVLNVEITQEDIDLLERLDLLGTDKTEWADVAKAIRTLLDRSGALAEALEALDRWRNP
jgi:hypothetical protein